MFDVARLRAAPVRIRLGAVRNRLLARLESLPELVVDSALAVLMLAVEVSVKNLLPGQYPGWSSVPTIVGLVVGSLALAVRRRAPRLTLAVAVLPAVLALWTGFPIGDIGLSIALFTMAERSPRGQSLIALIVLMSLKVILAFRYPDTSVLIPVLAYFFVVARWFGCQRQTERALRRELEHERELRVRQATADERARIARDLHDVVAHSVSVMVLHTSAARRTLHRDPERADEAFAQVEATGRQSLTELRQLLGLLRQDGQAGELRPQPSLDHLDELVDGFTEIGLPVVVRIIGDIQPLSPVVDLCAYRIVQEALTNSLKHADASTAVVTLRYSGPELRIEIVDDGRARPPADRMLILGHGLLGMRERTALVGGRLTVGHRSGGGFRVCAELPMAG